MRSPTDTVADAQIPVTRFAYNKETESHTARAPTKKFIKGPIPLEWISRANTLPGKAGAVGLALWFLAGVQKTQTVKLTGEVEKIAGCGRKAVYAGLVALEGAGLVSVERRCGARATTQFVCSGATRKVVWCPARPAVGLWRLALRCSFPPQPAALPIRPGGAP